MKTINIFQLFDGYLDVIISKDDDIDRDYFKKHVVDLIPYSEVEDKILRWSHHGPIGVAKSDKSWYPNRDSFRFFDFYKHFPRYMNCKPGLFAVLNSHQLAVKTNLSEGVFVRIEN